ncbi:aldo/keto reductase, partial [Xanthomonas sp. Kuri4-1]
QCVEGGQSAGSATAPAGGCSRAERHGSCRFRSGMQGGMARRFCEVAAALGESPARLAIAWCLRNPHVSSVILGASRVEQLEENLGALQTLERLEDGAWAQVEAAVA